MLNPLPPGAVAWEEPLGYHRFAAGAARLGSPALDQEFTELMEAIAGVLDPQHSGAQPSADEIAACASLLDHIVCASRGPAGPA